MWLPQLAPGIPAYLAIVEEIARGIRCGALRPGDRLPAHRLLGDLLGLNVSTVTRAYHEAARRGLVSGETGRGTYVLARATEARLFALDQRPLRDLVDLSTNTPPLEQRDVDLARSVAAISAGEAAATLHYLTPGDWLVHRAAAAGWLRSRGLDVDPQHIVVCAGAQHALDVAIGLVGDTDAIAVEAFTYPGLKALARQRQLRLAPLAMDAEGVTPEAFESACRSLPGRLAILSPTLHNPTTATMGLARRVAIVAIARRHDALILEEDVYGLLAEDAPPPLAALAPERVCYISGLSKTIAPGLRIGYLVLPPRLRERLVDAEHHTSWYVSSLSATLATHWLNDGTALARLCRQRAELVARHRIVVDCLGGMDWAGRADCPHVWLRPRRGDSADFVARARAAGVAVVGDAAFSAGRGGGYAGVRISIGAAVNREQLRKGLGALAALE
jgi:DNA-binding transcriptional MocR family regulator